MDAKKYDTSDNAGCAGWLGKAIAILLIWILLASVAWYFLSRGGGSEESASTEDGNAGQVAGTSNTSVAPRTNEDSGPPVEIGVAYGTEKRRWLNFAVEEFEKTPAGRRIKVNLIPMGSVEGANAVLDGDERITVWSPASSMYREKFEQEWELNPANSGKPIAKEELLALTPMVFVMWKERYDAFKMKYPEVSFDAISQALSEPGGWGGIAEKPEWGVFKFAHTHPNQSNSGLMTLVLMAYDFHQKNKGLAVANIVDPGFQEWLAKTERGVSGLSNSTGNMMRQMVLKGPSAYDAVMVYESVAIDFLKNAEGRWGELQVVYPTRNMWNDNPYYILNTKWTTPEQRKAAETFLEFLMSEPIQSQALEHGFRPGNTAVPIKFPESPFEKYAKYGLEIPLNEMADPPSAQVLTNLQETWPRVVGNR